MTFDQLLAEGAAVPVDGWDFSWFEGRATEERPSWGYSRMLAGQLARASSAVDLMTGGGEVYAAALGGFPGVAVATEAWPPNALVAARTLGAVGAHVVHTDGHPFAPGSFDLVSSRHPVAVDWPEIARVLRPGGTYLAQHIGYGTVRELTEYMMGPRPPVPPDQLGDIRRGATAAGLTITRLEAEHTRMTFHDIAAVVHFLRKVIWTVPDFTVDRYLPRLRDLHHHLETEGPFVAHSRRVLVQAHLPTPTPPRP